MVALQIISARYLVPLLTLPRQHTEPGSRVRSLHWLERNQVLSHLGNKWQQTVWEHGIVAGVRAERLSPPKGPTVREHSATQWQDTSVSCTLYTLPKKGSVPRRISTPLINSTFKLCLTCLTCLSSIAFGLLGNKGMHAYNGNMPKTIKRTYVPPVEPFTPPTPWNAYLINNNGLAPVKGHSVNSSFNKLGFLKSLFSTWNLDVAWVTETHDYDLSKLGTKWHVAQSRYTKGKHGTAIISKHPISCSKEGWNVTAAEIALEGEKIWHVSAYFPNKESGTVRAVREVDRILSKLKTKRIILAADFNSTETVNSYDTVGSLPPTVHRRKRGNIIQELLDKWHLKDLWMNNKMRRGR